jgi:hypothetical protein
VNPEPPSFLNNSENPFIDLSFDLKMNSLYEKVKEAFLKQKQKSHEKFYSIAGFYAQFDADFGTENIPDQRHEFR